MTDRPIIDRLLGPDEPELGCDECFAYLDRYVEAEAAGEAALEDCPACVSPEACAVLSRDAGASQGLPGVRGGVREPEGPAGGILSARAEAPPARRHLRPGGR
jgi:hypothetical protein